MATLTYRGRQPDSDFTIVHKKFADQQYDALKVDNAFIDSAVAAEMVDRVTPDYVNTQDGFRAHKAAVDTADAGYLLATTLGAASGVARLGADVYIPSAQLPTVTTERIPFFKNADSIFLSDIREVTSLNPKEYQAASLAIPDLGYPYTPLFFAVVRGGAANGTVVSRAMGNGNYGQISVIRSDNTRYGYTVTSGQRGYESFTCLPTSDVQTPLSGAATFGLYLGLQSGSTYTFTSEGLRFYCVCLPGV